MWVREKTKKRSACDRESSPVVHEIKANQVSTSIIVVLCCLNVHSHARKDFLVEGSVASVNNSTGANVPDFVGIVRVCWGGAEVYSSFGLRLKFLSLCLFDVGQCFTSKDSKIG